MKKNKIMLSLILILILLTSCNKPAVERTKADKAYYEYCIVFVDIFDPEKIPEFWDEKRIKYLTSKDFESKYEKLKGAVEIYKSVMTDKNTSTLANINRHIEDTEKFIHYAKKANELGITTKEEIFTKMSDEDRLDYAIVETGIKIAYDAMLGIIAAWEKTTPVYVD